MNNDHINSIRYKRLRYSYNYVLDCQYNHKDAINTELYKTSLKSAQTAYIYDIIAIMFNPIITTIAEKSHEQSQNC